MPPVSGRRPRDAHARTPRNRDIQPDGTAWSCVEDSPGTERVSAGLALMAACRPLNKHPLPPPPRLAARIVQAATWPSDFPSRWCSPLRASSPLSARACLARGEICVCLRLPEHHHEESLICEFLIRARKNCRPRQPSMNCWRQRTQRAMNPRLDPSLRAAGSSCHITNPTWACFSPTWPAR